MDWIFIPTNRFVSSYSLVAEKGKEKKKLVTTIWKYSPNERKKIDLSSDRKMSIEEIHIVIIQFECTELLTPEIYLPIWCETLSVVKVKVWGRCLTK